MNESVAETSVTRQMAALRIFARMQMPVLPDKSKWEVRPYGGTGLCGVVSVTFPAKNIKRVYDWMAEPQFAGFGDYQIWRAYAAEDISGLEGVVTDALKCVRELFEFVTADSPPQLPNSLVEETSSGA